VKYVPAFDGIRALAVLAVVMVHSKVPGFGGGFIGVDVFFVLSGYLITQVLAEDSINWLQPLPRLKVRSRRQHATL
jgi:peptidoglycan/LPS O-acetylase OafA/YrhL